MENFVFPFVLSIGLTDLRHSVEQEKRLEIGPLAIPITTISGISMNVLRANASLFALTQNVSLEFFLLFFNYVTKAFRSTRARRQNL